jgi:hypothetical protein
MRKEVGALVGAFVLIFACLLVVGFGWLVCEETSFCFVSFRTKEGSRNAVGCGLQPSLTLEEGKY